MKISFELDAEFREDQGKGASRRLRHLGKVPAIRLTNQKWRSTRLPTQAVTLLLQVGLAHIR